MKKEQDKTYHIEPLFEHFNENHELKIMGYQHILNNLANNHLKNTNQGVGVVLFGRYAWVLVSMTFEIVKPITKIKTYIGKTWYGGKKGPFYRREYLMYDEDGDVFVKGSSHSILMDLTDRSVYRKKDLPFNELNEVNDYLVSSNARLKENFDFNILFEKRKVLNSHVDALGHVNNLRYSEFIYDEFNIEEVKKLKEIKRVELYFQNELQKNDEFIIKKAVDENRVIFEIFNTLSKQKAFSLILHYN